MSESTSTVDREAETKEPLTDDNNENIVVNRLKATVEEEVDRASSTQEDSSTKINFYVHQTEKQSLLKGLPFGPNICAVGQILTFGRGEDVDVFLNDDTVSRKHMEMTSHLHHLTKQINFKVRVVSKTLAVNVSNIVLKCGGEQYLQQKDVLKIGQLMFTIEIVPGNDSSSFVLEFKRFSQHFQQYPSQNPVPMPLQPQAPQMYTQIPQYHLGQVVPQYQPQLPNGSHVQIPYVQPHLGYPAIGVPITGYCPPSAATQGFQIGMQPILPTHGNYQAQTSPSSFPIEIRHADEQSRGRSASENEETVNSVLSIQETTPPGLASLGESFEETQPPKQ